ncbi:tyrosine-type recombinase/integrase, partial [Vibrio parahaemolyticus]|nr:tyrosine-type recombinase/integrase [Vibrio parahaemolyticus]
CRHGARLANNTILKTRKSAIVNQERGSSISKALSHEDAIPVLSEVKTMRDRLFLSLVMGTGLREIEAANILLQDIDVKNKSIRCVNPLSRPLAYGNAFESLHGETAHDMAYKG